MPPFPPAVRQKCLLVVDDDADTLESLAMSLQAVMGARVVTAASGREALTKLDGARPDAMVTDYRMPGMDGIELTGRARRQAPGLPVVMVTAFDDQALRAEAKRAGVCEVVPKPLDAEDLALRIIDCLDAAP